MRELQMRGAVFVAHNAAFEQAIWENTGYPPPEFICTMALAQSHGLPGGLGRAAKSLQLSFQKEVSGTRLINMYCKPAKDGEFRVLEGEDLQDMMYYCAMDVEVEREIFKRLPKLNAWEQGIFQLTQKINNRGIKIDTELASKASLFAKDLIGAANERLKELTDNKFYSLSQTVRLRNYLNDQYGLSLETVGSQELEEVLPFVSDPVAKEIITLRIGFGRSSSAKFDKASGAVCDDGRVRNYLIYHGASTGRWTSHTIQLQNLPRGIDIDADTCISLIKNADPEVFNMFYPDPMGAISSCIRGLFVAEEGKTFYVVDYASIEARVLMWLAGEKKAVSLFKQGADLYVEMAKVIHNNQKLTKENKKERQLGKQAILGCGYGMGHKKFMATCLSYGMDVDETLAEKAVKAYRKMHKKVVSFWYDLESAAVQTMRTGKAHRCGPVRFTREGEFLYCQLPSKRKLAYYKPLLEEGKLVYFTQDSQTHNFKKTNTYGGKLCENVCQAVARDIMADAMVRLETFNLPIVLSVHDEIVVEAKQKAGRLEQVIDLMKTLPEWAQGCPIDAEGFETKRYKK